MFVVSFCVSGKRGTYSTSAIFSIINNMSGSVSISNLTFLKKSAYHAISGTEKKQAGLSS